MQGHAPSSNGNVASASQAAGAEQQHDADGRGVPLQHHHAEHAVERSSRAASIQDSEMGRADADLEASVLDTLTDSVLTGVQPGLVGLPNSACMQ